MIGALQEALAIIFSGDTLLWLAAGLLLGIFVGAIPGVGTSLGMAILLPLTAPLESQDAIILLAAIYLGGNYGGSVAAILINAPGTSAAAATTLDGYPMSRKGEASRALAMSAISSTLGGFIGLGFLILISPVVTALVLQFRSQDYFLVSLLGILMITLIARGPLIKGVAIAGLGLLLTTVGVSPIGLEQRYTFGSVYLFDGVDFVAILIGLFAVSEMYKLMTESGGISKGDVGVSSEIAPGIRDALNRPKTIFKSSLIGIAVGAIPGAGASISTFIAYGEAVRSSNEEFGNGNPDGVVSVESCNNSTVGGSLIPTFSFGIPGGAATAVLLGGMLMHGLVPGPQMFDADLHITYSIFTALFLGNFIILAVGLLVITRIGIVTQVDTMYIIPVVLVVALSGSYLLRMNWVDVLTVLFMGIIGYYLRENNWSVIALVLGAVLGDLMESNLNRALQLSDGSFMIFVSRPLSLALVVACFLVLFGGHLKERAKRITAR
ncbi:putative tricarboxylic transport membrane protein [Natronorubrum sediminis]|uniref:Putative tricarboxylic transport membrane protein n=1 Tax=Natronorubrum sediminis TaxID=640943 RepID=A0A1H6FTT1_9EURY|nr:tripartite tricarboxylate transporter permease [Natronorubrum sediminis]SEH13568.1 putative tricarboxylic transport membrane protein [Natronorubrum sediminis]